MSAPRFHVEVFTSLETGKHPVDDVWADAEVTDARFATDMTGFGGGQFGTNASTGYPVLGYLPKLMDVQEGYHIEVTVGSAGIYEGRVQSVDHGAGYMARGFTTEGYFQMLADRWQRSTDASTLTTGEVLASFLATELPHLTPGIGAQWKDPNIEHPLSGATGGLRDFYKQDGAQLAGQIISEGNSQGSQIAIQVWDGRSVWIVDRTEPVDHDYELGFDARVLRWATNKEGMVSSVTVEYENLTTGVTALTSERFTAGFEEDHGFSKETIIAAGRMTLNGANAIRDRALLEGAQKRVQATIAVTTEETTWVETPGGIPWPFYLVRAGRWIKVADQPKQPILAVNVNMAQGATYQLGAFDPALGSNMNLSGRRSEHAQRTAMNLNGGRTR